MAFMGDTSAINRGRVPSDGCRSIFYRSLKRATRARDTAEAHRRARRAALEVGELHATQTIERSLSLAVA